MKDENWTRIGVGKVVILYRSNLNRMKRLVNVVLTIIDSVDRNRGYSDIVLPPPIVTIYQLDTVVYRLRRKEEGNYEGS